MSGLKTESSHQAVHRFFLYRGADEMAAGAVDGLMRAFERTQSVSRRLAMRLRQDGRVVKIALHHDVWRVTTDIVQRIAVGKLGGIRCPAHAHPLLGAIEGTFGECGITMGEILARVRDSGGLHRRRIGVLRLGWGKHRFGAEKAGKRATCRLAP